MPNNYDEIAREHLMKDADHMVASGNDLAWLAVQLAAYPKRVDPDCTTNMRFLMMSAAATLLAEARRAEKMREALELSRLAMGMDLESQLRSACLIVDDEPVRQLADPGAEPWLQAKERALEKVRAALEEQPS